MPYDNREMATVGRKLPQPPEGTTFWIQNKR